MDAKAGVVVVTAPYARFDFNDGPQRYMHVPHPFCFPLWTCPSQHLRMLCGMQFSASEKLMLRGDERTVALDPQRIPPFTNLKDSLMLLFQMDNKSFLFEAETEDFGLAVFVHSRHMDICTGFPVLDISFAFVLPEDIDGGNFAAFIQQKSLPHKCACTRSELLFAQSLFSHLVSLCRNKLPLLPSTKSISRPKFQRCFLPLFLKTSSERQVDPVPSDPTPSCASCGATNPTKTCGGCRKAKYCDSSCQLNHWRSEHKAQCERTLK